MKNPDCWYLMAGTDPISLSIRKITGFPKAGNQRN